MIILSGDRHEAAAASLRTTVTEFSTSPLSMFYLPIRTVSQSHGRGATGEDVLLQYLPDGNSKFSTFEVDTRIANEPVVRVKVWIDGAESPAWSVEVRGKPIDVPRPPSAIGSLGKSLLELLGFKVSLPDSGDRSGYRLQVTGSGLASHGGGSVLLIHHCLVAIILAPPETKLVLESPESKRTNWRRLDRCPRIIARRRRTRQGKEGGQREGRRERKRGMDSAFERGHLTNALVPNP